MSNTIMPDDVDDIVERAEAERIRRQTRENDILGAPEARGRENLAFALALRRDIDAPKARQIMAAAPDGLKTASKILAYVAKVAPEPATRH